MAARDSFFSQNNGAMLQRVLYNDICRRTGGDLTEKQATRLMRTVDHYMQEVYRVQGNKATLKVLNQEVLTVVLPDYLQYMERQRRSSGRSVMSDIEEGPGEAQQEVVARIEDIQIKRQSMDIDSAFSHLQQQRQQTKAKPPAPPDFRLSLRDEAPVAMDVFERIKMDREDEAKRVAAAQNAQQASMNAANAGQQNFVTAADSFARERRRAEDEAEAAFAERERQRLQVRAAASGTLPEPPDMRSLFLGDRATEGLNRTLNRETPMTTMPPASAGNPAIAIPSMPRSMDGGLQQQLVVREPDVMPYKETELNLFVYSGDRDWISNSTETRYNFSVLFDPGNMPVGLHLSPTVTNKFKNITRIELVKAIMPGENLESFITRSNSSGTITYASPYNFNVLSFPFIQVRIPELDNNSYGTNQSVNAAFGVLQYDANWISDTTNPDSRGYFAMIPKFMKCQKTYTPTPLATLQKLSFQFQRPDSSLLSTVPDTLDILHIYSSKMIAAATTFNYAYDSAVDISGAGYYLIRTRNYFNDLTVAVGDRIVIKNLGWNATPTGSAVAQTSDFLNYIQQDNGLLVVAVGYGTAPAANGATANITLTPNSAGYCNYLVVRGKFLDPSTGATLASSLGGIADISSPGSYTNFTSFLYTNDCVTGRLLNTNHQVQVALRVIVRELDPTGILRPDNTF